ncbi:hypothetical protein BDQ12DRAFT_712456 [Crucibulum laeve]|uniref:Uncharacterized protein n=1 Tax=Crucibulum laeve TaxID=68775 RepID=A0A5C3M3G5_9AGAR|nr:hypothetical protein BDQ12DRAFT_712456 [Crucibulum laeve]
MSIQISTINAKVPQDGKTEGYFVEAMLDSKRIAKKKFEKRNPVAQYTFNIPYSLRDGATLKIQVKKKRLVHKDDVLIEAEFTTEIAQKLLGEENTLKLTDRVLSSLDTKFEILLSFSMSPSAQQDLIKAAVEVSKELRSVLDRMGIGREILAKLIVFGGAASEVHSHEICQ